MADLLHRHQSSGYGSEEACRDVLTTIDLDRRWLAGLSRIMVVVLAGFHIVKELFQLVQAGLSYFGIENTIEWICYINALLFVYDTTSCHAETGLREDWQWLVGSVAITASWLNLVRLYQMLGSIEKGITTCLTTSLPAVKREEVSLPGHLRGHVHQRAEDLPQVLPHLHPVYHRLGARVPRSHSRSREHRQDMINMHHFFFNHWGFF